jgi:hypothetical protein
VICDCGHPANHHGSGRPMSVGRSGVSGYELTQIDMRCYEPGCNCLWFVARPENQPKGAMSGQNAIPDP